MKESRMLPLGTTAPRFTLPDAAGKPHSLDDFAASPALLVAFICNHCPYVLHILDGFVSYAREYAPRGLAVIAVSVNDVRAYPQDGPEAMGRLAAARGFTFPYVFDDSQRVAKDYEAVCTPDFFLFDQARRLVYRGQFDASRPRSVAPVTGADLRAATDAVLRGGAPAAKQVPSAGCSIKWKPGNEPDWA
jgi:peroxiredoxin